MAAGEGGTSLGRGLLWPGTTDRIGGTPRTTGAETPGSDQHRASRNQDVDPLSVLRPSPGLWAERKPGNQSKTLAGLDLLSVSPTWESGSLSPSGSQLWPPLRSLA